MKLPLPLFLLIVLFACSSTKENSEQEITERIDAFVSYPLSIHSDQTKLADLIESVELIRLEETDNSLLSRVSRLINHKDQYLVLNKRDDEIVFFDKDGTYLKSFNRSGKGPEEYDVIWDFWVQGDRLSIYSLKTSTISNYTLSGGFIDSKRLPTRVGHIVGYKDQYVVDANFTPLNDSLMYKYGVLGGNLNPAHLYLKYNEAPNYEVWDDHSTLTRYNDGILLFRAYTDTIYHFKDNEFKLIVHLDFGDQWYWKSNKKYSSEGSEFIESTQEEVVWATDMYLGSNFVFAGGVVSMSHWEYFLIDRSSQGVKRIDMGKDAESNYEMTGLGWDDNALMFSMLPGDALTLINEVGEERLDFKFELDVLETSENPVLIKVKFKRSADW